MATETTNQQTETQDTQTHADPNATRTETTTTQQTADYWAKEFVGADGKLNQTAWDKAPDDLKGLRDEFGRFSTLDQALKSVAEKNKLLGKKGLFEPLPANATDEQKRERLELLRKVNQTPDKPEGYGFQRPQDLPEQFWDQQYAADVMKIMHEEGVSPAAAKRLMERASAQTQAAIKAQQEGERAWFEGQDKLAREVLAKDGLKMEDAVKWAQAFGRRFGIAPDNPVFKNASVLLAAARAGRLLSESSLVQGDANEFRLSASMTPESAKKEWESCIHDKNNPVYAAYWNRDGKHTDTEVAAARAHVAKLRGIAFQGSPRRTR